MGRPTAILFLCLFLLPFFTAGKNRCGAAAEPDTLSGVYLYTEGIKRNLIAGDSVKARELFTEAVRRDSTLAPAYYELVVNGMYGDPDEAVELARRAYRLDTANMWYHQSYGTSLIMAGRYREALGVYRELQVLYPKDPDNYRLLAALYEQTADPYMALATLDSAEMRFGRIPLLSTMKRRLLINTKQIDKAIEEARELAEEIPFEAQHHVVLGELYGLAGKDSLALASFGRAMQIDSTDISTLMSLADYHTSKQNYRELLGITKRLYESDDMPLDSKIRRFEQFTSDIRFYRQYYLQLNDLASTLAIRYPDDKQVVELYAGHLIASGELEEALSLYKLHLEDEPPVEEYYHAVIDIESYLQRPDSAMLYIARALERFPERIEFHLAKGHIRLRTGNNDKAVKAYRNALKYADSDSLRGAVWGMIGDAWHQKAEAEKKGSAGARKAMKECYKSYERSLACLRDNPSVLNNYAYFLALEGRDLERALEMSSRAVALTDNNPTYLDTHAWVLFRLGRLAEAKRTIQQAVAFDRQESAELLVHYGDILHAGGETFAAEVYWRKALEKGYDAREIEQRLQRTQSEKQTPR